MVAATMSLLPKSTSTISTISSKRSLPMPGSPIYCNERKSQHRAHFHSPLSKKQLDDNEYNDNDDDDDDEIDSNQIERSNLNKSSSNKQNRDPSSSSSLSENKKVKYESPRIITSDTKLFPDSWCTATMWRHPHDRWNSISEQAGIHRQDGTVLILSKRIMNPIALQYGLPSSVASLVQDIHIPLVTASTGTSSRSREQSKSLLPSWLDVISVLCKNLKHISILDVCCGDNGETMSTYPQKLSTNNTTNTNTNTSNNNIYSPKSRRLYILYRLPKLISIDGKSVTVAERLLARPNQQHQPQPQQQHLNHLQSKRGNMMPFSANHHPVSTATIREENNMTYRIIQRLHPSTENEQQQQQQQRKSIKNPCTSSSSTQHDPEWSSTKSKSQSLFDCFDENDDDETTSDVIRDPCSIEISLSGTVVEVKNNEEKVPVVVGRANKIMCRSSSLLTKDISDKSNIITRSNANSTSSNKCNSTVKKFPIILRHRQAQAVAALADLDRYEYSSSSVVTTSTAACEWSAACGSLTFPYFSKCKPTKLLVCNSSTINNNNRQGGLSIKHQGRKSAATTTTGTTTAAATATTTKKSTTLSSMSSRHGESDDKISTRTQRSHQQQHQFQMRLGTTTNTNNHNKTTMNTMLHKSSGRMHTSNRSCSSSSSSGSSSSSVENNHEQQNHERKDDPKSSSYRKDMELPQDETIPPSDSMEPLILSSSIERIKLRPLLDMAVCAGNTASNDDSNSMAIDPISCANQIDNASATGLINSNKPSTSILVGIPTVTAPSELASDSKTTASHTIESNTYPVTSPMIESMHSSSSAVSCANSLVCTNRQPILSSHSLSSPFPMQFRARGKGTKTVDTQLSSNVACAPLTIHTKFHPEVYTINDNLQPPVQAPKLNIRMNLSQVSTNCMSETSIDSTDKERTCDGIPNSTMVSIETIDSSTMVPCIRSQSTVSKPTVDTTIDTIIAPVVEKNNTNKNCITNKTTTSTAAWPKPPCYGGPTSSTKPRIPVKYTGETLSCDYKIRQQLKQQRRDTSRNKWKQKIQARRTSILDTEEDDDDEELDDEYDLDTSLEDVDGEDCDEEESRDGLSSSSSSRGSSSSDLETENEITLSTSRRTTAINKMHK